MNNKKIELGKCGNCGHNIMVDSTISQCRHEGNSYLCLVTDCQCLDATGRNVPIEGSRYPFNAKSFWNKDCLRGVIHNW